MVALTRVHKAEPGSTRGLDLSGTVMVLMMWSLVLRTGWMRMILLRGSLLALLYVVSIRGPQDDGGHVCPLHKC